MNRVLCFVIVVCAVESLPMSKEELEDFSNFLLKTSQLDLQVKKGADPDFDLDENELVSDHAWEESGKFEGDLILNDRQRRLIVENVEGLSRNGLTDSTKKWPNNEVVYFIQREHFNSGQVQAIQNGIDDLAQASCVKFRPYRKGDRDAVVIQGSRPGCFSQVGYQGGYQVLNLSGRHPVGRGCFRHGTVVHELLHSLGFYHMQSSPDRDDYINVMWANIVQPARHNFRKYNSFSVSDFGVGYDYDSVLHYSRKAFSANGQDTLVPKQHGAEIGQRVGLSNKDTQKLNKMYCDADNDAALADENGAQKPKIKKKKPKNQPFQGHGIGYHQGKTLVIKLPVAQTYKLPNVPSTSVFDFSKTPQIVSTAEAEGYGFGKGVMHSFIPMITNGGPSIGYKNQDTFIISHNGSQDSSKSHEDKKATMKTNKSGYSPTSQNSNPNEVKPEYIPIDEHDRNLKESFYKLTKIVKQHIYPKNYNNYSPDIDKDYSKFYSPTSKKTFNKKFEDLISYNPPTSTTRKLINTKQKPKYEIKDYHTIEKEKLAEDKMGSFFRTSLPIKKPYSSYIQTETPLYATQEYLKDKHNFSNIYSPTVSDDRKWENYSEETSGEDSKLHKVSYDDLNKSTISEKLYTDYLSENSSKLNNSLKVVTPSFIEKLTKNKSNLDIIEDRMDSSYRTHFSIPKRLYSAYGPTETPKYATLKYHKDRHNFSDYYTLNSPDIEKQKETYMIIKGENESSESDWNKNHAHKHSPAHYNKDFYTEYSNQGSKSPISETPDHSTERYTRLNKTDPNYYEGFYADNEGYEHEDHPADDSYDYSDENKETGKTSNNDDHWSDYRDAVDNDREGPSKKSEEYKLFNVPVPVTNDWFKPDYSIPKFSSEDDHSLSHEDINR